MFKTTYYLKFGTMGLLLLQPLIFTSTRLSKLKLFLKRATRKGDKTKRKTWFGLFPHLPFSKKAANVRMGKGKGKLKTWFTRVAAGNTVVEYKNLRFGRALYFFKQTSYRLGVTTKNIFSNYKFLNFPMRTDKNFFLKHFDFKTFCNQYFTKAKSIYYTIFYCYGMA